MCHDTHVLEGGQPWVSISSSALSLVIGCCVCQAGWPVNFQGLSCLCPAGVADLDDHTQGVLGIGAQVLMLVSSPLSS